MSHIAVTTIDVSSNIRITVDRYQWILNRPQVSTNKETGEKRTIWKPYGYYVTLAQAIEACVQQEISSEEFTTLEGLRYVWEGYRDLIERVIDESCIENHASARNKEIVAEAENSL